MKNSRPSIVALAATALFLSACGGGGGATTTTPSTTTADTSAPATSTRSSTIDPTVASAGYAANSPESAVYAPMNAQRVQCGFGSVAQNASLDKAAKPHANWLMLNNYSSHSEDPSLPNGFTGADLKSRSVAAGYV
jgi:uncharacterized protein YkwD